MAKKISIVLLLLIFAFMASGKCSYALWGDSQKESKLDKDSYEKLVKKNLELRNEVETLAKEQERLRGIYKILLEKVKSLQKENDALMKQIETAGKVTPPKKSAKSAKELIAEPYTEPSSVDMKGGRAEGVREGISANKEIIEAQSRTIRDQEAQISELEDEMAKLKSVFNMADLKKKFPEAFARKEEAEKFKNSPAANRVKEEVEKIEAKQSVRKKDLKALNIESENIRVKIEDLKNRQAYADNRISELKNFIANAISESKNAAEQSAGAQDRIKSLERLLDAATTEERDAGSKLKDLAAKKTQIEESIKKSISNPKAKPGDETASLEKDLEKAVSDEKSFRERTQESEKKIADLKQAIDEARAAAEENAYRATANKDIIKNNEKEIADNEAARSAVKKDLQGLSKKMSVLKYKEDKLSQAIDADEKKARDFKKIIEKKMVEISNVWESQSGRNGIAGDAQATLTMLSSRIKELKEQNEELAKELKSAKKSDKKKLRENELPPEIKKKLDKERLDMHYNLAVVYDKTGMYKDAEREYVKCLTIDPNDADVHYNLGILYDDKLNLNHKAHVHYQRFLELRPMGDNATLVRVWLTGIELEKRLGKEAR